MITIIYNKFKNLIESPKKNPLTKPKETNITPKKIAQ